MSAALDLRRSHGPRWLGENHARFSVWAPEHESLELLLVEPVSGELTMEREPRGFHAVEVESVAPDQRYLFRLPDGRELPDPASRRQPDGVHAASALVGPAPARAARPFPVPAKEDLVLYELHVGTFTDEGTFDAAAPRLAELRELGITAIELMPVAAFPGERNWGYDGVQLWAVQESYGGPAGLRRFADACHEHGLAVLLDVVYNHLGPEGNYLGAFSPRYFNERYRTPWGAAVNLDGSGSDEVRAFLVGSALHHFEENGVDGFRVDAVHAFLDTSAQPFLRELTEAVHRSAARRGRRALVIAESDLNDPKLVRSPEAGGYGMDAQWSDDFHHALHALLTGERSGYYRDFGSLEDLARAYEDVFVYGGRYSAHRGRRHGALPAGCPADRFVVFTQNHDQVGNRARGDRLDALVDPSATRLAAAALLLSPFVPLLFMGQEYGETAPFQYFTSHGDLELGEAVRAGRREEFAAFGWDPAEIPDPQDVATFERSRPRRSSPADGQVALLELYRELLRLRREEPALRRPTREGVSAVPLESERVLLVHRWSPAGDRAAFALSFADEPARVALPRRSGRWYKLLDTEEPRWGGRRERQLPADLPGEGAAVLVAPRSCVLFALRP